MSKFERFPLISAAYERRTSQKCESSSTAHFHTVPSTDDERELFVVGHMQLGGARSSADDRTVVTARFLVGTD